MHILKILTWTGVALLLGFGAVHAQTLANPDISVVADTRLVFLKGETADALGKKEVEFEFTEIEFNFNAYLNPYMRADVFLGLHEGEGPVEVEQASMTVLRGLPLSLQFTFGKTLLDFGRINTQHPHQWGWLEFPLMHRTMIGEEGARVVGANVSTFQAVGKTAVTLSLNAFDGGSWGHEHGHEGEEEHAGEETHEEEEEPAEIMYSGRVSAFRSLTDGLSAELGASYFYGEYDPAEGLEQSLAGVDWKLRWRPDTYRSFNWIAEVFYSDRDVAHEHEEEHEEALTLDTQQEAHAEEAQEVEQLEAWGAFSAVELQFRRRYDVGAFYDWTQDAEIADAETTAAGGWVAFMPAEETARFSLVYRYETSDLYDFDNHGVTFQIVWALGPHQPHTY